MVAQRFPAPRSRQPRRSTTDGFARAQSAIDNWLASLRSSNTLSAYRRDLQLFANWMAAKGETVLDATTADIDRFKAFCEASGSGRATVHRRLTALSSFYGRLASTNGQSNPVTRVARPAASVRSETQPLTSAQSSLVWDAAVALGRKTAAVVGLVLHDGMKTNEILLLDVEHFEITRPRVIALLKRRNGFDRITLDSRTAAVIRDYVADRDAGPLLIGGNPARQGTRMTRFGVDYLIKRTGILAGLNVPLTANTLRSTHISSALGSGHELDDVSRAVGHASSRTTKRYLRAAPTPAARRP